MTTPNTPVQTETVGSALVITINRPAARNAIDAAAAHGIAAAIAELEAAYGTGPEAYRERSEKRDRKQNALNATRQNIDN